MSFGSEVERDRGEQLRRGVAMKALTIALLLALAAVLSMAPNVHAAAAVFIDLFVCGMLDGNGAPVLTTDNQVVVTNNARGNGKVSCFADVTDRKSVV